MRAPLDILVLRDPREAVQRCSLTPLRGMPGLRIVSYKPELELAADGRVLLHPDGELLEPADAEFARAGLLLVDCSWRRLASLLRVVRGDPPRRRLPPLRTAYPRKSHSFPDPDQGLASVEALYAAVAILSGPRPELLAGYRWADEFLSANRELPAPRGD
jgi:pre-rRNA-processing protein TSR3